MQLLSCVLNTAVRVVLLAFKQILNTPGCRFVEGRHALQCQQRHGLIVYKTQIFFLELEVIQRFITARKNNKKHVVVPYFLKLCKCKRQVTNRWIGHVYTAITNGSEHNKVLEARMMDRNDSRVIEINQVVDRRAEAARRITQCSNEAFHIEHGKSPARNDAFTFAVMQQAFHHLT